MGNLDKYIGLQKGVLTVVEILKPTVNNKYTVVKCLCSKCGQYSEVRLDRLTIQAPYAQHFCEHCREDYYLQKAKDRYVGVKNGVLECIDVKKSPIKKDKWPSRTVAVCKCSVCRSITEVRPERLINKGKYIPQSCGNCVNDLYRKTTKQRYYDSYQCSGEEYERKHHDSERIKKFKSGAKQRNISYTLLDEEAIALLHSNCYYCGKPHADGIDRIDSLKGYSSDNCVPCCTICNIMKNKFSTDVFFDHIKLIYNKHFSNNKSQTT